MIAHAIGLATLDNALQPLPIAHMIRRIGTMGIDEDVNVGENHAPASIRASKAAELSRFTPGRTP